MGRYIYFLLACGLFDISRISATNSGPAPDTAAGIADGTVAGTVGTVKSQQEQDAENKAKKYEDLFVAFIEKNKEEYKCLIRNREAIDAFEMNISDDKFDLNNIEIDYADIPTIINNWINSLPQNQKLPNTFKKLFFKEINIKGSTDQGWRLGWKFDRKYDDKEKYIWMFNDNLSESKIRSFLEKLPKIEIYNSLLHLKEWGYEVSNELLDQLKKLDSHKILENNELDDILQALFLNREFNVMSKKHAAILILAGFLQNQNKSLTIWRIRDIMYIPLKQSFLLEPQRNESTKPPEDKLPEDKPKSKSWINSLRRWG